ncbi:NTP transferase domain-containing protein [Streptomyces sp. MI02-7b]|uniref:nucleotidyltransferase family protein n=1 Tax=Streptomyces sp. MI02-7b TaxID=462941 RepID=UPI0029AF39D6|nr:NTP transferase domain-containing protein [Streptomyces sp. MI02-7b]MDX3072189.1 NTP transferase domain-containing protein [Streptomyces sp. MI02-7b]
MERDGSSGTRPAVAGLLLAAGAGRRLGGRPKALLEYGGRPLVEHAARALRDGVRGPVHIVLGAAAGEVRARAALDGCAVTVNPDWEQGMGSSLRAGLASLAATGAAAAVVALVDQPGVGAAAVARVAAAYASPETLASAAYDGRRGHPILLGAGHWPAIAASAVGDQGARSYLRRHEAAVVLVECADIALPGDIDTPDDLWRLGSGPPRPPAPGATKR